MPGSFQAVPFGVDSSLSLQVSRLRKSLTHQSALILCRLFGFSLNELTSLCALRYDRLYSKSGWFIWSPPLPTW